MKWYPIPNTPFEANEAGQIRNPNTNRVLKCGYKDKRRTRKKFHSKWVKNGITYKINTAVARVVLTAKLGRPLLSWEDACHINGDNTDDRMENLEAKSRLRNIIDEYKIGRLHPIPNEEIDKAIKDLVSLKK
jgi:hypothetical protein|tara:strand:- start:593 stop:988 length:396 start_codon:yes stop_codon:yes gene_type:complete